MAELGLPADFLIYVLALLGAGAVAGVMAGLFGIGGGAVLVPVLYEFYRLLDVPEAIRLHVAVATSLGVIVPTSLRSFRAHYKRGTVDMALLKSWVPTVIVGVLLASLVAAYISGQGLKIIFACIATLVAFKMLMGKTEWKLGEDVPPHPLRGLFGVMIGFFSTLMGIGGGILVNTVMTLYNRAIHQAVSTASGVGVAISVPGVLGMIWAGWGAAGTPPVSLGFVNLLAVFIIIPVSILAAPVGVNIAHALSRRRLEIAFGIFLLFVAARFIFSIFA